ncbi:RNA polymerase sigma-70 factor [Pontibacter diazotrophicus]|uniref:RNA polymerase sigma-70 factor n=1 Tax=Pontibacter diazotrophicus TaxID=1400979 RepID=A0A3D8KZQ9_9BACT|nr:RNA polymerase sigma-70 factor [Pontibacter diazotrophicus]RDV10704.1 RNA polymerase sigma-70 factor [Pontibacter diazotrophicus]
MPEHQDGLPQYKALFRSQYQHLCLRVHRITRDADAAEDIVQDVFVSFWNNEDRQQITTPEAYLYRAAINKALNYASSQKRRGELEAQYRAQQPLSDNSTEQGLQLQETQQKVQDAIELLPPICQKVFLLSRYEEMSHKEIADFLSISTNTVDNHIKKALAVLRKVLLSLLLVLFEIIFNFFS